MVTCSPTLNVYCDIIHTTPINGLPRGMVYQYNKLDMRNFCEQNFTIVSTPIRSTSSGSTFYQWISLSKCWNWLICHTHQAFKLPLPAFSGKLRTFPTMKSKTIGFLLDQTQQYTPVLFAKLLVSYFRKKSC